MKMNTQTKIKMIMMSPSMKNKKLTFVIKRMVKLSREDLSVRDLLVMNKVRIVSKKVKKLNSNQAALKQSHIKRLFLRTTKIKL
jgi:hypothetical protein